MARINLNKLVAINAFNANNNIIATTTNNVLKLTLQAENERLMKRYPSLRTTLYV